MSHTLHRSGSRESLSNDYVILIMPENGLNDENSKERLLKCFDILMKANPVNMGDSKNGSRFSLGSDELVKQAIEEKETIFAVYQCEEDLVQVLRELKEADTGLSVVVSGLFDHTCKCAADAGLKPHTCAESLGIYGNKSKLPEGEILDISVMCGHGLISFNLVSELVNQVKAGQITAAKAAEKLAACCICGVFNPVRAEEIIRSMM